MEIHRHTVSYFVSVCASIISILSDFIKKDIGNMKEYIVKLFGAGIIFLISAHPVYKM